MTVKCSAAVVNNMLDSIETTIGLTAVVRLWAGTIRANCATADDSTVTNIVATMTLSGTDWAAAASAGSKSFLNTPITDSSADNAGTLTYFRLYAAGGTTCHMQGTITATGGGGDMTVDNVSVSAAQQINITGWSWNLTNHYP
jgi:hypothetical protein